MSQDNMIKVGIRASGPEAWQLHFVDIETDKILPVKIGTIQMNIPDNGDWSSGVITADVRLTINEVDLQNIPIDIKEAIIRKAQ